MRIAHLASEVVPFSKTGGLADVAGALPVAQAGLGHEVTVVAPGHRASLAETLPGRRAFEVKALGLAATVMEVSHGGVRVLLLDAPPLYVRPALYTLPDGDFPDNAIRFAFFVRAALAALARTGPYEVVHAHDWQAALAPVLLAEDPAAGAALPNARTVLTIHNLAYQGTFAPWVLEPCELPRAWFTTELLEFYGRVNLLKAGLASAGAITTVSPTYAREILTPEFGCGLEGVLAGRSGALTGILNGLDTSEWDPAHDAALARPFAARGATAGKRAARAQLAQEQGVAASERPLLGMVSRLAEQKGADVVFAALDDALALGFDLVVLGTGERRYEDALHAAAAAHPDRVAVFARFDERLAHQIYAASDFFLMPSRYEPCGLGQLIAMRYGSLPIVNRTGGLADTVTDAANAGGTGVVFAPLTPAALGAALARAHAIFKDGARLAALRATAMARDFSWHASAQRYLALYQAMPARAVPRENSSGSRAAR
jgi:starch synthase